MLSWTEKPSVAVIWRKALVRYHRETHRQYSSPKWTAKSIWCFWFTLPRTLSKQINIGLCFCYFSKRSKCGANPNMTVHVAFLSPRWNCRAICPRPFRRLTEWCCNEEDENAIFIMRCMPRGTWSPYTIRWWHKQPYYFIWHVVLCALHHFECVLQRFSLPPAHHDYFYLYLALNQNTLQSNANAI